MARQGGDHSSILRICPASLHRPFVTIFSDIGSALHLLYRTSLVIFVRVVSSNQAPQLMHAGGTSPISVGLPWRVPRFHNYIEGPGQQGSYTASGFL